MNIKYQKLVKTGQEPEYKVSPFLVISSIGAEIKKNSSSMPYGTAVLTDTGSASSLKSQGINYIIHATPMPEGDSREKFVEVAARTIQNSIILAEREGISKLATCFLAGKIYLKHPSSRPYLAEGIIEAALNQLQENSLQEVIFVDYDGDFYQDAWNKIKTKSDCPPTISKTRVEKGNLCQKSLHGAEAIVNSEKVEMSWGGGISGAILGALGTEANNVDQQRKSLMKKFNELINGQQQKDNNKKPNQQEPNKNDKPNPGKDEKQPSDDSQEPTPDNGNGNNDNGGNKKDDNQEPTDKGQKNSNDTDKNPSDWREELKAVDGNLEQSFTDEKINEWKQEKGSFNTTEGVKNLLESVKDNNNFLTEISSKHSTSDLNNLIANKSPQEVITIIKRFEYDQLNADDKKNKDAKIRKHYSLEKNADLTDSQINDYLYKVAVGEINESSIKLDNNSGQINPQENTILKIVSIGALILVGGALFILVIRFITKKKKR